MNDTKRRWVLCPDETAATPVDQIDGDPTEGGRCILVDLPADADTGHVHQIWDSATVFGGYDVQACADAFRVECKKAGLDVTVITVLSDDEVDEDDEA